MWLGSKRYEYLYMPNVSGPPNNRIVTTNDKKQTTTEIAQD